MIEIVGWICRRCRYWASVPDRPDRCPECLFTGFEVVVDVVPFTERQAEQLLTGQEA